MYLTSQRIQDFLEGFISFEGNNPLFVSGGWGIEKAVPCDHRLSSLDKVRKKPQIRNLYNQVPHLTQHTTWKSDKKQENITYKSANRLVPVCDYKAAINRLTE